MIQVSWPGYSKRETRHLRISINVIFKMHLQKTLALLASSAWLASAVPSDGLRLIKTSPEDLGVWVTEEEKITEYTAKGKHFIDITDITVSFQLSHCTVPINANFARTQKSSPSCPPPSQRSPPSPHAPSPIQPAQPGKRRPTL